MELQPDNFAHAAGLETAANTAATSIQAHFEKLQSEISVQYNEANRLNRIASDTLREQIRIAVSDRRNQQVEFDELLRRSTAKLEAHQQTFSRDLALRAPVAYWTTKRRWHVGFAVGWLLVAGVTIFLANSYLTKTWTFLFEHTQSEKSVEWWRIGTFVIFATFALWVVRILVQLFLSNVHLATDAAERATMIQAYLALLKEENAICTTNEKQVIMAVVFRPATSGVIKDDGVPSTVIERLFNCIEPPKT